MYYVCISEYLIILQISNDGQYIKMDVEFFPFHFYLDL